MKLERWPWRQVSLGLIAVWVGCAAVADIEISGFRTNGLLEWTDTAQPKNATYRVEVGASPAGPWVLRHNSLIAVAPAPGGAASVILPPSELPGKSAALFYRVAFNEVLAVRPADPNYALLAMSVTGERLALTSDLRKLVYVATDGATATIFLGTNGLPTQVVDGDSVIVFGNYTSNSVDVGSVSASGLGKVVRGVALPAAARPVNLASALRQIQASPVTLHAESAMSFQALVEFASWALSAGSCAATVAVPVAAVVTAQACGGLAVKLLAAYLESTTISASATGLDGMLCVVRGDALSCVSATLDMIERALAEANQKQEQRRGLIDEMAELLNWGDTEVARGWWRVEYAGGSSGLDLRFYANASGVLNAQLWQNTLIAECTVQQSGGSVVLPWYVDPADPDHPLSWFDLSIVTSRSMTGFDYETLDGVSYESFPITCTFVRP